MVSNPLVLNVSGSFAQNKSFPYGFWFLVAKSKRTPGDGESDLEEEFAE